MSGRRGDRRLETIASGTGFRDPARPSEASRSPGCEQHHGVALPDNDRAERSGFVETVIPKSSPGVARTLRDPFHILSSPAA